MLSVQIVLSRIVSNEHLVIIVDHIIRCSRLTHKVIEEQLFFEVSIKVIAQEAWLQGALNLKLIFKCIWIVQVLIKKCLRDPMENTFSLTVRF